MPTARDVANRAGVSQSTVSRVLNNHPHVRPETRKRVLDAIAELDYHPNQAARSLVTQRTGSIGLVVGDIRNPFFAETAKGIVDTSRSYGYRVVLCTTDNQDTLQSEAIKLLRSQEVDGLIFGSVRMDDAEVLALIESGFPCVLYNRVLKTDAGSYVVLDNRKGARMATEHLLKLGHRRIAVLTGSRQFSTFAHRLEGYSEVLREYGIPVDRHLILDHQAYAADRIGTLRRLLGQRRPPTAIFALTDDYALQVLDTLAELDVPVPEGMAVVGFDDIRIAGHSRIGLTTVAQRKDLMGRLAVESLMELITARAEGRTPQPIRLVLEPQLIVRRTCGAQR
ncbi:LacI family DNA-binding transcriptional regulator [Caldinitratiruptor microaerophilus]|uniref:LacI family transcriptional regulator n=1 Tax=Caldinitratiruptor microaerophilus TaxID=671077 RepID=A0AA35G6J6_9FIRM|nr:LacI family DNA-binding transcriptional regulator [Caldinitratiruptor microaerophilus]BDG59061.1 LacI family transcriptional regulator [Caldinitratiruptor microaerophilus]